MRRRHLFSAPFVLTACGGARPAPAPAPPAIEIPVDDEVSITEFGDPECYRQGDVVDCPEELLPVAGAERLVVGVDDRCFVAIEPGDDYERDEGRVRCPEGGPTVTLPEEMEVRFENHDFRFDPHKLTCEKHVISNPPHWEPDEPCPPTLLPTLAPGVAPLTTTSGRCWWHAIEVRCARDATNASRIRIIQMTKDQDGTWITLNIGTSDGFEQHMTGRIVGLDGGEFTIAACSEDTCKALVHHTSDEIKRAGSSVELDR